MGPGDRRDAGPFTVVLPGPSTLDCGAPVDFNLNPSAGGSVPFRLTTGSPGPQQSYAPVSGPVAIPDGAGFSDTPIEVAQAGRVKDLEVRVGSITHSYDGDLDIRLVSPDGTSVTLINATRAPGSDFAGTVFARSASQSISTASAPYAGRYRPVEDLAAFDGRQMQGTWHVIITDHFPGNAGTLNSTGVDVKPASCLAVPQAGFSADPSAAPAGTTVTFTNDSRDPTTRLASFVWDFGDGGPALVVDKNTRTVTHSFLSRGTHTVRLQMKDTGGAVLDETTAPVLSDQLPVAHLVAPPDVTDTSTVAMLDATTSVPDPAGRIDRYEFDEGDGVFRDNLTSPTHTFRFTTSGVHTVRVRVTDDVGATSIAQATVTVGNTAPTASFGGPSVWQAYGRTATFDASGSTDPDGTIATYRWDFDGDGTWDTAPLTTPETSHVYPLDASGPTPDRTYTVRLKVTDNQDAWSVTTRTVDITAPPTVTVVAPATLPYRTLRGAPVSFSVNGSSDVGTWEWDLDGNGSFETSGSPTQTHTYTSLGRVDVQVRAKDDRQIATIVAVPVDVANTSPVARLTINPNPGEAGKPVTFDASASSDAEGAITGYVWDLDGDGSYETNTGVQPTVTRTYANAGRIAVKVRVVDSDGVGAVATDTLTINPAPAPAADPGTPPGGTTPGGTASGSPGVSAGASVPGAGPAAPGAGAGTPGAGTGSGATPATPFSAALAGPAVQALKLVLRSGVGLTCQVDRSATCDVSLTVAAGDAKRLRIAKVKGRRPVVIGTATAKATQAGPTTLRVKLTAAAARRLRTVRKIVVQVVGTASDAAGGRVRLVRGLLLRR